MRTGSAGCSSWLHACMHGRTRCSSRVDGARRMAPLSTWQERWAQCPLPLKLSARGVGPITSTLYNHRVTARMLAAGRRAHTPMQRMWPCRRHSPMDASRVSIAMPSASTSLACLLGLTSVCVLRTSRTHATLAPSALLRAPITCSCSQSPSRSTCARPAPTRTKTPRSAGYTPHAARSVLSACLSGACQRVRARGCARSTPACLLQHAGVG